MNVPEGSFNKVHEEMMEKKKAIEKIKKIHQYHNQVKDLYRPVPSEIKKVELEMVNKKRETIVRVKQPY